jgi:hypothetical protein
MTRLFYVNRDARPGETFGVFADPQAAERALRSCGRSLSTHTICKSEVGYVVLYRGYWR